MFSRKDKSPLIITPADDKRAAEINKKIILDSLINASDSAFVQFLDDNGIDVTEITPENVNARRESVMQDYRGMKPESFTALNVDEIIYPSILLKSDKLAEMATRAAEEERRGNTFTTVLTSGSIIAAFTALVMSTYSSLKDPAVADGPRIDPAITADFHGAIKADVSSTAPPARIVTAQAPPPAPMPRPPGLD